MWIPAIIHLIPCSRQLWPSSIFLATGSCCCKPYCSDWNSPCEHTVMWCCSEFVYKLYASLIQCYRYGRLFAVFDVAYLNPSAHQPTYMYWSDTRGCASSVYIHVMIRYQRMCFIRMLEASQRVLCSLRLICQGRSKGQLRIYSNVSYNACFKHMPWTGITFRCN